MLPRLLLLACVGSVALVAGCGSTTVHHVTVTVTQSTPTGSTTAGGGAESTSTGGPSAPAASAPPATTSSSSSTTRSAPPARSRVAGRSPRAIIDAAASALRHAGGYAMRADLRQGATRTVLDLDASGPRSFDASLLTGSTVTELIGLPSASYLRGNIAFWRDHVGKGPGARARAGRLANHWLKLRPAGARSVTKTLGSLAPSVVARCLTEDHGTLSLAGHTTIDHTRALVVKDSGDVPGGTPSTIAVADSGPPYPLRYTATGATRPGGRRDVCNDGKGGDSEGTIRFRRFGEVPAIRPPAAARTAGGPSI